MSERFFLSEEEITRKYGKPIISIGGSWSHSDVYYDAENDSFIEERYHEEYLDTGTVCDGCFLLSDSMLWDKLVEGCNEEGMSTYLKIRQNPPKSEQQGNAISMDDFREKLNTLKQNEPWRCCYYEQIGSVIIITNEANTVLGVVGKSDKYCFFYDPKSDVKRQGFHTWGEALAVALKRITFYHNDRVERDKASQAKCSVPAGRPPKKSLFEKLLGK